MFNFIFSLPPCQLILISRWQEWAETQECLQLWVAPANSSGQKSIGANFFLKSRQKTFHACLASQWLEWQEKDTLDNWASIKPSSSSSSSTLPPLHLLNFFCQLYWLDAEYGQHHPPGHPHHKQQQQQQQQHGGDDQKDLRTWSGDHFLRGRRQREPTPLQSRAMNISQLQLPTPKCRIYPSSIYKHFYKTFGNNYSRYFNTFVNI